MYPPIIPAGVPCDGGTRHVLVQSDLSSLAASLDFDVSEVESRIAGMHIFVKLPNQMLLSWSIQ
jgi:hypothetical protein